MASTPMDVGAFEKAIDLGPSPAAKDSSPDTLVLEGDEAGAGRCASLPETKCNGPDEVIPVRALKLFATKTMKTE